MGVDANAEQDEELAGSVFAEPGDRWQEATAAVRQGGRKRPLSTVADETIHKLHHREKANDVTGDTTKRTNPDGGLRRRVNEGRAVSVRRPGSANAAGPRVPHERALEGAGGAYPAGTGLEAGAAPRRPSEAASFRASADGVATEASATAGGAADDRTTEVGRGGCGALGYAATESARSVAGGAGAHMEVAANTDAPTRMSSNGAVAHEEGYEAPDRTVAGDGVEAAAGYDDVGDGNPAELTTIKCHHEGAASGTTGDVTGTHVDGGPGRRVDEDRAAGIRRQDWRLWRIRERRTKALMWGPEVQTPRASGRERRQYLGGRRGARARLRPG